MRRDSALQHVRSWTLPVSCSQVFGYFAMLLAQ